MVSEEVKFNTGVSSVSGSGSTSSAQSTGAAKSDYTNTVFDEFKKRAIKQGIELTLEDFQRFLNSNPDFSSKSPEEQVTLFNNFLTAQKTEQTEETGETPEETQTSTDTEATEEASAEQAAPSAETAEPAEDTAAPAKTTQAEQTETAEQTQKTNFFAAAQTEEETSVTSTDETTKAEETETPATTKSSNFFTSEKKEADATKLDKSEKKQSVDFTKAEEQESFTQKADGLGYDSVKFSKMEPDMKAKSYVYEYAKNKFLYSGDKPKSQEEWNKLSKDEQFKLIQACSKEIDEDYQRAFEAKTGKKADSISSDYIEMKMLQLQAASENNMTVEKFGSESSVAQAAYVAEMLSSKEQMCPDRMSDIEKSNLKKANFILDACKEQLERQGKTDAAKGLCFEDIAKCAENGGKLEFSIGTAIKNKLASVPENQRTEEQKAAMAFLESVPDKYLNDFGANLGQPTALDNEVRSDEEFAAKYDAAKTPAQKAQVKAEYYQAKCLEHPETFTQYMSEAIKSGDADEIAALFKLAETNETLQKALANTEGSVQAATTGNVQALGSDINNHDLFIDNLNNDNDAQRASALKNSALDNLKNVSNVTKDIKKHWGEKTQNDSDINVKHKAISFIIGESDNIDELQISYNMADKETKKLYAMHANEAKEDLQAATVGLVANDQDKEVRTEGMKNFLNNKTLGKMANSQQTEAFKSVHKVLENDLPRQEAVKELNKLADQISSCDKKNQLAMHEEISSSKYQEVVTHAAQNIHNYDESVQAQALRTTYEKASATGNIEAIQAATAQVELMAPSAVAAMSSEIQTQIAVLEERGIMMALDEIKSAIGMDNKQLNNSDKTQMQKYIEELMGMPKSEIYRKIVADIKTYPTYIQQLLLDAIVKSKGELFTMMINKYGIDMLTMFGNMSSIMKSEILKEMLKTPSMRADAMNYISQNPTANYSSGVQDLYNDLVADKEGASSVEDLERKAAATEENNLYENFSSFGAQSGFNRTNLTSISDVADKYGFYTRKDILGRVGLIS